MKIPKTMRAMVLEAVGQPLVLSEVPVPAPERSQILVKVEACGVCRTDLHIVDGELTEPKLPLIPGHEIVGRVVANGSSADTFEVGTRVGIPWLGWACGRCRFCKRGEENLCDAPRFTGYTLDGGFAEYTVADQRFCFPIAGKTDAARVAPLLCAGLIGYRSYRKAGDDVQILGLYGFGAAAHIIAQVARWEGRRVFAFVRPGDEEGKQFARRLGAEWVGDSTEEPPEKLDAAIIFAPVGALVPEALHHLEKGGTVVCGGIHMSDVPSFPYRDLWEDRSVVSVANLTRRDGGELLEIAPEVPIRTEVEIFPLRDANEALRRLRDGELHGAAVLEIP